jgi:hypothetical protein
LGRHLQAELDAWTGYPPAWKPAVGDMLIGFIDSYEVVCPPTVYTDLNALFCKPFKAATLTRPSRRPKPNKYAIRGNKHDRTRLDERELLILFHC